MLAWIKRAQHVGSGELCSVPEHRLKVEPVGIAGKSGCGVWKKNLSQVLGPAQFEVCSRHLWRWKK